jgi:hypothetical protein
VKQMRTALFWNHGFLTFKDGTERLSQNVGNELLLQLRNNPEERDSKLGSDRILRCRKLRWSECGSSGGSKNCTRNFDEETLVAAVKIMR